jgi:hypothetical protein
MSKTDPKLYQLLQFSRIMSLYVGLGTYVANLSLRDTLAAAGP